MRDNRKKIAIKEKRTDEKTVIRNMYMNKEQQQYKRWGERSKCRWNPAKERRRKGRNKRRNEARKETRTKEPTKNESTEKRKHE